MGGKENYLQYKTEFLLFPIDTQLATPLGFSFMFFTPKWSFVP